MGTKRNLHSHKFASPVSGRQEVSCFGEEGEGDSGDSWVLECKDKLDGEDIDGRTLFYLKHLETAQYLYTDSNSMYDRYNCRNCPIIGQAEISTHRSKNHYGLWKFVSGYFFAPGDKDQAADMEDANMGDYLDEADDINEDL